MTTTSPRIEDYPWGRMEWLVDYASHPAAKSSLAKMVIAPGADTPLHRHDNCSEIMHVLAVTVELFVGEGAPLPLGIGDTSVVSAYTSHSLRNTGKEDAVLILSYSAANRAFTALST